MNLSLLLSLITVYFSIASGSDVEPTIEHPNAFFDACLNAKTIKLNKYFETNRIPANVDDPIDASNTSPLLLLVEKAAFYAGKDNVRAAEIADIINKLVIHGADLNRVTDSGWTALNKAVFWASENPAYPIEIIDSLLPESQKCPSINVTTHSRTPLHFAAASTTRSLELVNKLLERCEYLIDYGAFDSKGWTPLKAAINAGNIDVKNLLYPKTPRYTFLQKLGMLSATVLLSIFAFYLYIKYAKAKVVKNEVDKKSEFDSDDASDGESVNSEALVTERKVKFAEEKE